MTGSACTIIVDIFSLGYLAKVFEYLSIHFIDVVDGDRSSIFEYDFALTFIDLFDDTGMLYIRSTTMRSSSSIPASTIESPLALRM